MNLYIPWWAVAGVLFSIATGFCLRAIVIGRRSPNWVEIAGRPFPNLSGSGSAIMGFVVAAVAVAFLMGHAMS